MRPRDIYLHPGDNTIELELDQQATLSGRVVSETGEPRAGVQVQTAPRGCASVVQRVALTDNSGAFTLTGLPGGCIAWVGLRAADRVASPERSAARFLASDDARADNMVLVAVPTPATNKRVEVPARPAADEAHVRSANSAVASDLSFENTRDESVLVYWIDESGTRRFYVRIGSKRTISMGTFVDHAWVITDDHDKALVVFVPTTRLAHATIR